MREYPLKVWNSTLSQGFYCGWRDYKHWTRCKDCKVICRFPPKKTIGWPSSSPRYADESGPQGQTQEIPNAHGRCFRWALAVEPWQPWPWDASSCFGGRTRPKSNQHDLFWHASIMSRTFVPILDFWVSLLKPKALLVEFPANHSTERGQRLNHALHACDRVGALSIAASSDVLDPGWLYASKWKTTVKLRTRAG